MQRNTGNTESITVEYGFLDSKLDDVNQLKNNWQDYAEAVVKALLEYLNISYIPADNKYYVVKSGDTLWSIAKRYNTSIDIIKELNNLSNSTIKVGDKLLIPTDDNDIYIVKKGDTLWSIANKYNVTVNDLFNINKLTSSIISIGQQLYIPKSNNEYIVKSGDTLWSIAKNNNISVQELKEKNKLSSDILKVGQVLTI